MDKKLKPDARKERLARALRENLKKRKAADGHAERPEETTKSGKNAGDARHGPNRAVKDI